MSSAALVPDVLHCFGRERCTPLCTACRSLQLTVHYSSPFTAPRPQSLPPIPAPAAPEDMTQGYGGATGGTPAGTPDSQVTKEVSGAC